MKRLLFLAFLAICFKSIGQIRLVEDLIPGTESSNPNIFIEHDGLLFFIGSSPSGAAIYTMDASENITIAHNGASSSLVVYNGQIYFNENNQLNRLNEPYGTGSTIIDNTLSVFGSGYVYNGELYWGGEQNQTDPLNPNYELMAYDGASVRLVEEESAISLSPNQFVEHLGELHFVGEEIAIVNGSPETINRIYKTDGTTVEIVVASLLNNSVSYLSSLNDTLYFLYRNGGFNEPYNLWYKTLNATAGFGEPISFAFGLAVLNNKLYYFNENTGILYARDSSGESVIPVAPGLDYPSVSFPLLGTNQMAFSGFSNSMGIELYTYEPSGEIRLTEDYNTGIDNFLPAYGSYYNDKLYVTGDDGSGIGRELHVYEESQIKTVEVSVTSGQTTDPLGNYIITAGTNEITIGFDLEDESGNEVPTTALNSYELIVNTLQHPTSNPATGGVIPTQGVDFELLTNEQINVNTVSNGEDGNQAIKIGGDGIFEGDEFFFIEVSSNDPNIALKNAENGIVRIPVKIIDNEVTDITLTLDQNGAEPSQNARLRITSSLQNDSGAPLPFNITLSGGTAILGEDYQDLVNQPEIADGESSVEFDVIILNNDSEAETEEEFFANISYGGDLNNETQRVFIQNGSQEVTITDDGNVNQNTFGVSTSIGGDVVEVSGTACCPEYEIEEGQLIEINFNADSNATLGEQYIVQVSFANGTATENDVSIRENSPNLQYTYSVKTTSPDNILQIDIIDDMIAEMGSENLRITLTPIGTNFIFNGTAVYDVVIKDRTPFAVTTTVNGASTGPNYTIEEGQSFALNFETGNTGAIGTNYNPIITITKDGVETTEDFTIDDLDKSFTINTNDPDGIILFTANDDGVTEGNETYIITIATEETSTYTISNPNSFEITLTDKVDNNNDSFNVNLTLGGDVVNIGSEANPNYQISEGGSLIINVEAIGNTVNTSYSIGYNDNLSELPNDFFRNFFVDNELSQIFFEPDTNQNPDESYVIQVVNDGVVDEVNEQIQLNFLPNGNYTINGSNNNQDFTITIIDIDDANSNEIFASLDNTGGTEGGIDTFTIELTEGGEPWINNSGQEINFPVTFSNERLDGSGIDVAENGDYNPTSGTIIIPPNASSGELSISLIEDTDSNHEHYLVSIQLATSGIPINITNNSIEAKIIDKEAAFTIEATIKGIIIIEPSACCPIYGIEEGELLEITLEAEKGVVDGTPFDLQINYFGSAIKDEDFNNRDTRDPTSPDNIFGYSAKTNVNPDNTIEILILTDSDNESDSFGFSITSTETEKYQLAGETTRSMNIIDPILAEIETVFNDANESPITNGEFSISLATSAQTNTKIFYELDVTSTANISDFQPLSGFVEIPAGDLSIPLIITPIDDEIVENIESVVIRLLDGTGYFIDDVSNIASIDIESDDIAQYVASIIEGNDNRAIEGVDTSFAEAIISLNEIPTTDVEVVIQINSKTNTTEVIEGVDYTIFQDNQSTVIDANNRVILFKAGETATKSIFIKALSDNEPESIETLFLSLDFGIGYEPGQENEAEIELVSESGDTANFNPGDITILVQSPRCPGNDQEGEIILTNKSPFAFDILLKGIDNPNIEKSGVLPNGNSLENDFPFNELPIGQYEISLQFQAGTNIDYPDVILPNYIVQIVPFLDMTAEEGLLLDDIISLKVSGSTVYNVNTNGEDYQFEFNDSSENIIKIPLKDGVNKLEIKGDTECKGVINKNILLKTINIYPNPGKDVVFINSSISGNESDIMLYNMAGKMVYRKDLDSNSNNHIINITTLESGMYLGIIKNNIGNQVEFKLLKN